ncbi:hypothetical protein ATK78_2910 [Pedobacter metabolipauper]|uniref:Luciferase domain-containing protein n=2 Tax=Pedobacter metabolipauper TaxID=425513 RepID=A0A4R6SSW7_9SPHI|nr:hypothetical protein ATK78_2910 [Pedobacter metabolipauper]
MDEIESDVMSREGASVGLHKYGGLQFNYYGKEIGHLHSNGLLDILFDRKVKQELLLEGKINHHHVFKNSGWISFYIQDAGDMNYAKELLSIAYEKKSKHLL